MKPIGIYIHIPFCDGKCPYCDFYSVSVDQEKMDIYTQAVCDNIKAWSSKISRPANTLYLGGGTPSLLGEERIIKIVQTARQHFLAQNSEITMEVNPTKGKNLDFHALRQCGINRLSVGLQSANNNELKLLGRKHSPQDAANTVSLAQSAGFNNISLDLMLGVQEQTEQSLLNSINFCNELNIQHISAYMLKIEENTPYYKNLNKMVLPDEDEQSRLYLLACSRLEELGFNQYEISNFAKPGKESKHNLKYWNIDEYIGIGPAAHSFIDGKRFYYPRSIQDFIDGAKPIIDGVGGDEQEYAIMQLRLSSGLRNSQFKEKFGYNIPKQYFKYCSLLEKNHFIEFSDEYIRLTPQGFLVSNEIISKIILNS